MSWWSISFGDGIPDDVDLDHIAEQIKQGYTSGEYSGEEPDEEGD